MSPTLPRVAQALLFSIAGFASGLPAQEVLTLGATETFDARGVNVRIFSIGYDDTFSDAKMAGVEIVHHGERNVTNGDVRLEPTPEQWDPISMIIRREVDREAGTVTVFLEYPAYGLAYSVLAEAGEGGAIVLSVNMEQPLPAALEGKAGFNMEFLPVAYFERSYLADGVGGTFPLHPYSEMTLTADGPQPLPLAQGHTLVLAPEDPEQRVTVESPTTPLALYDGRNTAQNGWFVVRSLLPAGKTGRVLEWRITASQIPGWTRAPVIAHSQVGYHPAQRKVAVIELDPNAAPQPQARLLRVLPDGTLRTAHEGPAAPWGPYLCYEYLTYDFSDVRESGVYVLEYAGHRTDAFRIAPDVYTNAWQPSLDVYLPVQMDHMTVNEGYRIWHGLSHMDDARQAPVNHMHFDLFGQGPTTDTPYAPGEHIPGLDIGGWFDAGDFDIRTQTHYATVTMLVNTWETFRPERDQTHIDQEARYVDLHRPDGKPDILQQIEHGTLALIAQHRAVGHAIPGIVAPTLEQYTHLGDAHSKTDGLIYDSTLGPLERKDGRSGVPDDRWAFTTHTTPLNYGSAAALAAASRALRGYNDALATECLATALKVWDEEHAAEPALFHVGNTTGGMLADEELKAAVELLLTTGEPRFANRVRELLPEMTADGRFLFNVVPLLRALPSMDAAYKDALRPHVEAYTAGIRALQEDNPFGVPITPHLWAGSSAVTGFAINNYYLHKAFPDLVDAESAYRGLHYLYGNHPDSDISFVSGVGTRSKRVAYGSNRADFSFIAGGVVPGVLILPPGYPENKEDWPFLWGENEYVVGGGATHIFAVHAIDSLLRE